MPSGPSAKTLAFRETNYGATRQILVCLSAQREQDYELKISRDGSDSGSYRYG